MNLTNNLVAIKTTIASLIFMLLFSGCVKDPEVIKEVKVVPAWIDAPLPSNKEDIYGLGVGKNKQEAIKLALSDMASKLSTTIESKLEIEQESQGSYFYKNSAKSSVKSNVKKIKINNYEVLKTHRFNYKEFAVMLKVNRIRMAEGLVRDLENSIESMKQERTMKNVNKLELYNQHKEHYDKSQKLMSDIFILQELKPSLNTKGYKSFLQTLQKDFLKEKENLSFYVRGNNNASKFVTTVQNYLAQNGLHVSKFISNNAIIINVEVEDNVVSDSYVNVAVVTIKIAVMHNAQRLGGETTVIKERYNGSRQNSYNNASLHFDEYINTLEIKKVIGIDINL